MKDIEVNGKILVVPDCVLQIEVTSISYQFFTDKTSFHIHLSVWSNEYIIQELEGGRWWVPIWNERIVREEEEVWATTTDSGSILLLEKV